MKRRGRLAAPSFFNMDDFRPSATNSASAAASTVSSANSGSNAGSFLHLDTPIRADDVTRRSFIANEFLSGHESLAGSSSSSSSAINSFAYSQKNFHTSDGNLYSVFSPLQGQRSRSRPSFLRQHLQQQQQKQQSQQQTSSTRGESTNQQQQQQQHHQQQQRYRFQTRQDVSSDPLLGSKYWKNDVDKDEDIRRRRMDWFERSSQLADDVETIFNKEKQKFHQTNRRSPSPVRFSSSRWPQDERLDISSLIKSKFGSSTNTTSAESLFQRKEMGVWSEDDDEDDDDDGPLNLCLADRRRRRKSSSSSSKSDIEDHHHHHHHHHLRRRRRHQASEEFNENRFSSYSSLFKRDFLFNDDVIRRRQKEEKEVEEEEDTFFNSRVFKDDVTVNQEPTVLDLSMKSTKTSSNSNQSSNRQHATNATETSQITPSVDEQKWAPSAIMDTSEWLKSAPENRKHFPKISEMLEKMHLRDDEWRQAMQMDSYRAALESTRERLIHTHPDMFYGWPTENDVGNKMDVAFQSQKLTESHNPQQFYKEQLQQQQQQQQPTPQQHQNATICSVKREDNISLRALNKPSNVHQQHQMDVQRIEPLRSCSAVTINADIISSSQHHQHQRPLAASSSCPEVPSLNDRSAKPRWTPTKVERPKGRPPRKSSVDSVSSCSSSTATSQSPFANDISICKFKLVKGLHPVLEEKKTLHVPLPVRSSPSSSPQRQQTPSAAEVVPGSSTASAVSSAFRFNVSSASPTTAPQQPSTSNEPMKTFKFYVDGAGSNGRKSNVSTLPGGGGVINHSRRVRKRSRKTLAREQLEATFREQGFLIKTQQVSSAEGAVYCKFRQLKKFTRYLFKSWKDHLPLEIQGGVENMTPPNVNSSVNTAKVSSTNENLPTV
ncbi:hypothetical protein CHUAL_008280 [Chamberlinius hualienensis]